MHRRTGVNALRSFDRFRNTSVRILSDLVEQALDGVGRAERCAVESHFAEAEAALLVALDQPLHVEPASPAEDGPPSAVVPPGAMHFPGGSRPAGGRVRIRSASGAPASCLLFPREFLDGAIAGSVPLARSFAGTAGPPLEAIWVCERPRLHAPLEPLTQLLAAAVARDFDEGTAILVARAAATLLLAWDGDRFVEVSLPRADAGLALADVSRALAERKDRPVHHLFVVDPEGTRRLPPALEDWRFHRIVYVTDTVPTEVPADLEHRLVAPVRNRLDPSAPYFGSFVASVVPPGGTPGLPFSEPLADDLVQAHAGGHHRPGWRIRRDACRVPIDLHALGHAWDAWVRERDRTMAFPLRVSHEYGEATSRWGRALTNRRVGLAVSGGGACSYRVVPLLQLLAQREVPIDLVSGVSGGALLGAYYCADGLAGVDRLVARGGLYQAVVTAAMLDSSAIERAVDRDLGRRRVDDLVVRFVPVTTALRGSLPPQAHVVVGGTLGQAVRVSGSAPLGFAPSSLAGMRFADGATSAPVPARALRDYGADLVFAANSIPAPGCSNPFDASLLGRFLYDQTVVGRLIDLWVSGAFLLDRISDEIAVDAHVYFEPPPAARPLVEAFQFYAARRIVAESAASAGLHETARECGERWHAFSWRRQAPG